MINKYGGDALRLYFMGSPLMLGENTNFDESEVKIN
jgi:leucyl-tRNA synthetase